MISDHEDHWSQGKPDVGPGLFMIDGDVHETHHPLVEYVISRWAADGWRWQPAN